MNEKQLAKQLVKMARDLSHTQREISKLTNRLNQLVESQRQPPTSSVVTTDSASKAYHLSIIDRRLRDLQKFLTVQVHAQTVALENELANPSSELGDFEIETQLHYILTKDDPQYDDEDDNILTTRTALVADASNAVPLEAQLSEIDTQNFADTPHHPMPIQGWLSHDVMEHDMGIDSPAIGPEGLLRVGRVWVEVITKRQYWLNLHTGQFEIINR